MTGTDPRVADLEQQAADLTARVELLEHHGLALKALLDNPGYGVGDRAGLRPSRSRHLMAIQGGER